MIQPTLPNAIALFESGRVEEGVEQLRQVAASGDPQALFILADLTWSGNGVPQDPARGRLLFEYAAALGHGEANILATNLFGNGIAGRRDWAMALSRLQDEGRQIPSRGAAAELVAAMDVDENGDPCSIREPRPIAERPHARLYEGLLTRAECDYLIGVAHDLFQPSMVYTKDRQAVRDTIRTSDGAAIHWLIEDPAIHALNRRIAAVTNTPYEQGEPLQVLRYSPGQEYRPHFDFVDVVENRRPWTALIYLNEDYEGGATEFVQTGVQVRGKTGDVLVFRNALEDGSKDSLAEHAGLPVTAGTKYLATRWIRERRWIP
jgi:prolyl 4-hydroxylase